MEKSVGHHLKWVSKVITAQKMGETDIMCLLMWSNGKYTTSFMENSCQKFFSCIVRKQSDKSRLWVFYKSTIVDTLKLTDPGSGKNTVKNITGMSEKFDYYFNDIKFP